jgi:hypothetical protein
LYITGGFGVHIEEELVCPIGISVKVPVIPE